MKIYELTRLVYGKTILELKAVSELHPRFEAQLLSYLKGTQVKIWVVSKFRK